MNIRELSYSRHFLVVADGKHFPEKAYQAASLFAKAFAKGLTLLALGDASEEFINKAESKGQEADYPFIFESCQGTLVDVCDLSERTETPIIFFEITKKGTYSNPMNIFKGLRDLRIPFVMVKEDTSKIDFSNIIVPIGYLPEEKEKAPYSSNMGRFLHSEILLLKANDYGSKTAKNVESIRSLFDKFNLKYEIRKAVNDSFKVEKEAVSIAAKENAGMVIISTSRDYGLDDMFFGPKELHIFKATTVPLMCINPRGDLYVLCW